MKKQGRVGLSAWFSRGEDGGGWLMPPSNASVHAGSVA